MNQTTQLAAGVIDGRDRLQIILVKPGQGRPALVQLLWPTRPTVVDAGQYPHTAAAIMRLFAALHRVGGVQAPLAMNR